MKILDLDQNSVQQTLNSISDDDVVALNATIHVIDIPIFKSIGHTHTFSIQLKNNIQRICKNAFEGSFVKKIKIQTSSLDNIEDETFMACKRLEEFDANESTVKDIGNKCFFSCNRLKTVLFPNTIRSLGNSCFGGCASLTSIELVDSITDIGEECFTSCPALNSIKLPKKLSVLKKHTFSYCRNLINVDLNNVQTIEFGSFYECNDLTKITIPSTVAKIEDCAFMNTNLHEITFLHSPNQKIEFGNCIFTGCKKLTNINCNAVILKQLMYNIKCL